MGRLEEIRLLGNLENRRGKMLQIILAGQPELDRNLEAGEYRQLSSASRCAASCSPSAPRRPRSTSRAASRVRDAGSDGFSARDSE